MIFQTKETYFHNTCFPNHPPKKYETNHYKYSNDSTFETCFLEIFWRRGRIHFDFLLEYEMKNCVFWGIVIALPKYTLFKRVCLRPILNIKSRPCVFSLNFRFVFINTVIRRDILGK